MTWRVSRTTGSAVLPVTLVEIKDHLNIAQGDTFQDDKLTDLIIGAKERVERDIDRITITGTFRASGPCFGDYILLNMKPINSILSVQYIDENGSLQTLDAADYRWVADRRELHPAIGGSWPATYAGLPDAVSVEFTAGYGTESGCLPRLITSAIKLCVGKWFYDPAQESSALHSQEQAYKNIINNLMRESYP